MCGICGIINKTGITVEERTLIKKMNEIQRHRGPDDEGEYIEKTVALEDVEKGFCSIRDDNTMKVVIHP